MNCSQERHTVRTSEQFYLYCRDEDTDNIHTRKPEAGYSQALCQRVSQGDTYDEEQEMVAYLLSSRQFETHHPNNLFG